MIEAGHELDVHFVTLDAKGRRSFRNLLRFAFQRGWHGLG